ncbi:TetR family transcriptional regulator C-terminal domain-containing protein [Antarcticirhabdus aurantiaca]|uniref:TetR family transcriptional regulator C-terminal domain-containing protein n=1 Tax=Antarcticirhabdus aurantiaca TaxID=2606717 RepID=A0ACD4NMH0_9HYPH|nr:TetR family transcriptional regulator C-terminal domain-containing protein [Antarcticirhabdus aurantiaca]WAJ28064.1 TetR family transcriptional regulator C-terminal domain-containing protein [Jeongeuplla avenae]
MTASFRRAPDFDRKADMIEATLDCIADVGIQATTVRAVAARAGVSNGLIRHHFESKDKLITAAYRRTIEMMSEPMLAVMKGPSQPPHARLAGFVVASLSGPNADPRLLSLWATFISQIHANPHFAQEHRVGYAAYREATEELIADVMTAEGRIPSVQERRRLAIAINAVIDGLWLEGCLSADEIDESLQISIGLRCVEALLGVELPDVRPEGKES